MTWVLLVSLVLGPLAASGDYNFDEGIYYPRKIGYVGPGHYRRGTPGYGGYDRYETENYGDWNPDSGYNYARGPDGYISHDKDRMEPGHYRKQYDHYKEHDLKADKSTEKKNEWKREEYDQPWKQRNRRLGPALYGTRHGHWVWKGDKNVKDDSAEEAGHSWWKYKNPQKEDKKSSVKDDKDCQDNNNKENSWEDYWQIWEKPTKAKKKCAKKKEDEGQIEEKKKYNGYGYFNRRIDQKSKDKDSGKEHRDYWDYRKQVSDHWKLSDSDSQKKPKKEKKSEGNKANKDKKDKLDYGQYYTKYFGGRYPHEDSDSSESLRDDGGQKSRDSGYHYQRHPFYHSSSKHSTDKDDPKKEEKNPEKQKHQDYRQKYKDDLDNYNKIWNEGQYEEEDRYQEGRERLTRKEKKKESSEEKKNEHKESRKKEYDKWWQNLGSNFHAGPYSGPHNYH